MTVIEIFKTPREINGIDFTCEPSKRWGKYNLKPTTNFSYPRLQENTTGYNSPKSNTSLESLHYPLNRVENYSKEIQSQSLSRIFRDEREPMHSRFPFQSLDPSTLSPYNSVVESNQINEQRRIGYYQHAHFANSSYSHGDEDNLSNGKNNSLFRSATSSITCSKSNDSNISSITSSKQLSHDVSDVLFQSSTFSETQSVPVNLNYQVYYN